MRRPRERLIGGLDRTSDPAIGVGFERAEAGTTLVISGQETVDELTERIETLAYDS